MKSQRIIISTVLQEEIVTKLHSAHQGTEKTKLRARTSVYWRRINKDIQEQNEQKEPLTPTEVPPRAWHTISNRPLQSSGFRVAFSR